MSWLLQGSRDGRNWTLLDRQNGNAKNMPFAVSRPMECRFIRIINTQFDHLYARLPNWDFRLGQRFDTQGVYDTRERDSIEFALAVAESTLCTALARFCRRIEVEFFETLSEGI
jgi:hypothetical protein